MKEIHQGAGAKTEKFRFVVFSHQEVKRNSQFENFSKTRDKLPMKFPSGFKAENFKNMEQQV